MKKLIAALSLGILVAGSSYAQTTPQKNQQDKKARTEQRGGRADRAKKSPEEMAHMRTERMSQKLGLNASQKNQLQALNLRQAQEMKAMRESYKAAGEPTAEDRTKMREARKGSHAKWQAELKGILTEKQYAQYETERAEMRSKRGEGKEGFKGKGHRGGEHRQQRS